MYPIGFTTALINGMVFKGQYYYFVTHDYPYIMKCFMGTPNSTFTHTPVNVARVIRVLRNILSLQRGEQKRQNPPRESTNRSNRTDRGNVSSKC